MDKLIRDMREAADVILALPPYSRAIVSPAVQLAVMAQKAADELEKTREIAVLWDMYGGSEGITDAFERAEKARWIPATERLPEDREMVIGFTPCDGFMFVGYHVTSIYHDRDFSRWYILTAMRGTQTMTKKVTHWMALPAPPMEDKP